MLSDHDDSWRPDKLQEIETVFCDRPEIGLVFSDALIVDEQSQSTGRYLWQAVGLNKAWRSGVRDGDLFGMLLKASRVTGATMAFRASFRSLVLPIPETWVHDEWVALLLSAIAPSAPIHKPLVDYRQHPNQQLGAPPFTWPARLQLLLKAKSGRLDYAAKAAKFNLALQRLAESAYAKGSVHRIAALQEKVNHLRHLSGLPKQRWHRLPLIFKETVSGRYRRYSRGWRIAAKDLLL